MVSAAADYLVQFPIAGDWHRPELEHREGVYPRNRGQAGKQDVVRKLIAWLSRSPVKCLRATSVDKLVRLDGAELSVETEVF